MLDGYVAWKRWRDADFGLVGREESVYFERELHASGIRALTGLRVGELGYGNGAFAGWVRAAGGRWIGRETIPELQTRALEAGFATIPPGAEFSTAWGDGSLDLIVAFDVVEHLDLCAIRAFLRESYAALKPGGLVLLRIPSGDSPFSSAIYRGDVTHRTLLGSSALRQLAREAGLDVRQIRSPVLPMVGYGAGRVVRRTVVRMLQSMAFAFIRHILMANDGAVLSPNMIVVLTR
jgi:SAM-dependent methyltransferase